MPQEASSTGSQANLAARVVELEIQVAHLQRAHDQLNQVVVGQSQALLKLERAALRLENQLKEVSQQRREFRDVLDEKPPHY